MRIYERVNKYMCNNNCEEDRNCICEILKVILVLQENACPESCLDSCDRPMLGGGPNCLICNTRPVQLFTCCGNGVAWSMSTTKDSTAICSSSLNDNDSGECSVVFRVEKLDGNCVTCRVLTDNSDQENLNPFIATNSFFTMDLSCICVVRCLSDTFVEF